MSTNKTPNLNLHSWAGSDYVKRTEFNDNFSTIDSVLGDIEKKDLSNYKMVKSVKDSEGMFSVVEYRTRDADVLVMKSTLSGGTAPQYTTRTEEWYASDGVTVEETIVYTLSYDSDGDLVSEV